MAMLFVQAQEFKLAGNGCTASATSIDVQSFQTPDGTNITDSDLGGTNYGTLEPGTSREEIISFTAVTQNADGTATLTGVTRGLKFVSDYTADASLKNAHSGGAKFVLTNNPQLYNAFVSEANDETITGLFTFSTLPKSSVTPTDSEHIATKAYVDGAAGSATNYNQTIVAGDAGESVSTGDWVYFKTSDQEWYKTDSDAAGTSQGVLIGVAQGSGSDGSAISGGIVIGGLDDNQSSLTAGDKYYLSGTAGAIANSAGTNECYVGTAKSTTEIFVVQSNLADINIKVLLETHASRHENGGADEISVAGLSGELVDNQPPKTHASSHSDGGTDELEADNLAGANGTSGQVLTTDGAATSWEEPTAKFGTGQTSRGNASGTGTQNIAHGLGVTPSLVQIYATRREGSGGHGNSACCGTATATDDETVTWWTSGDSGSSNSVQGQDGSSIIKLVENDSTTIMSEATVSTLDSTNITLTFTTHASSGDDLLIQWMAYA